MMPFLQRATRHRGSITSRRSFPESTTSSGCTDAVRREVGRVLDDFEKGELAGKSAEAEGDILATETETIIECVVQFRFASLIGHVV